MSDIHCGGCEHLYRTPRPEREWRCKLFNTSLECYAFEAVQCFMCRNGMKVETDKEGANATG